MKMRPEHFNAIRNAFLSVRENNPNIRDTYKKTGWSEVRCRWDLLWQVADNHILPIGFLSSLYTYLNDDNIDTALCKIVDELWPIT